MQQIEVDVDSQVRLAEAKVREKASRELENERHAREKLREELEQLQSHLGRLERVERTLKANKESMENERLGEVKCRLDEALQENQQMRLSLMDTQTKVAMLSNELLQFKMHYEEKCKELISERERVLEVVHGQDNLNRQLLLLQ